LRIQVSFPIIFVFVLTLVIWGLIGLTVSAQTESSPFPQATELKQGSPLTNDEFVQRLNQLRANPSETPRLVDDIRKRGISFPITPGLRSLVATRSGNDSSLLHTLDEANRRRINPTVVTPLPPVGETDALLQQARKAALGAAETMPDYLVKEQIVRYSALGGGKNWRPDDHLSVAVSYRQGVGEDYKLLSVNGLPPTEDQSYGLSLGGTTSAGEYVTALTDLFRPESQAEFQAVDTDTIRERHTVVYEFLIKKENSRNGLTFKEGTTPPISTVAGVRGRIWVDRENYRVLRLEQISTEIDPGFPITAASNVIDYEWVKINEQDHLLPSHAVVELTDHVRGQIAQTRNDILFRGYRKFGAEVLIKDVDEKDFPADKPEEEPKKPETPPTLKPPPVKKP
jgi:hypothetical protein